MKFVGKIFNVKLCSTLASAVVCAVKFVNSFARRQDLFDVAAKPIDVDSNFLSSNFI